MSSINVSPGQVGAAGVEPATARRATDVRPGPAGSARPAVLGGSGSGPVRPSPVGFSAGKVSADLPVLQEPAQHDTRVEADDYWAPEPIGHEAVAEWWAQQPESHRSGGAR